MINLLPASEKKELIKIEQEKIQIIILSLVSFFFICLVLLFLFLNIYFNAQLESEKSLIATLEKFEESEEIKERVAGINLELVKINNFYQDKIYYSEVLEKVFQTMPEKAYLNRLIFTEDRISLNGFIPTREELLIFQENLKQNFKEVEFPPANWAARENINFFVNFKYEKQ